MNGMITKVFNIELPNDIFDDSCENFSMELYHDLAINEARELAIDWVIPCQWESELIDDTGFYLKFRVKRISKKNKK